MRQTTISLTLTALLLTTLSTRIQANPFTPGDLAIYRVGDGASSLTSTGAPVFVDEYTPSGVLVQSIEMPTTADGGNNPLIASGTATSEGLMTLSADGQYLFLTGYDTTLNGPTTLAGTSSTSVPRVVGRVDFGGNINTTTALTNFASGNNPRSAVSTDGNSIWVGGAAGGIQYTTLGSTSALQLGTGVTNIRQVNVFNNQLYFSDSSGSSFRLGTAGPGLPTTSGQVYTNLPGLPSSGTSPYSFAMLTLQGGNAGLDTLYVADDATNGGSILKYSFTGGTWVNNGAITAAGVRGLVAETVVDGGSTNVMLFGTTGGSTATGGGSLYEFTDASGFDQAVSGSATVIATSATDEAFRGIAFVPVPEPSSFVLAGIGLLGLLAVRRLK